MARRVGEYELSSWKFKVKYNIRHNLPQLNRCENEHQPTDNPSNINEVTKT